MVVGKKGGKSFTGDDGSSYLVIGSADILRDLVGGRLLGVWGDLVGDLGREIFAADEVLAEV